MPVTCYKDVLSNKKQIISENEGKTGISRWTHVESDKSYIGSSKNLVSFFYKKKEETNRKET